MCNLFQFPGAWGILVGICLFLAAWWLAWLKLKGHGFAMDAEGKEGAFEPRLTNYLDISIGRKPTRASNIPETWRWALVVFYALVSAMRR